MALGPPPLYDIASALPYAHERDAQMAMKLGGDHRLHVLPARLVEGVVERAGRCALVIDR